MKNEDKLESITKIICCNIDIPPFPEVEAWIKENIDLSKIKESDFSESGLDWDSEYLENLEDRLLEWEDETQPHLLSKNDHISCYKF